MSLFLTLCMMTSAVSILGMPTTVLAQDVEAAEASTDLLVEEVSETPDSDYSEPSSADEGLSEPFAEAAESGTAQAGTEEEDEEEAEEEPVLLENAEHGVTITVPRDSIPKGVLAENIALEVRDLTAAEEKRYKKSLKSTQDEVIWTKDITLIDGATGKAFQPAEEVEITLNQVELETEGTLHVHRIEEDLSVTELEAAVSEDEDGAIVFETDHFTVYAVSTGGSQSYSDFVNTLKSVSPQAGDKVEINLDNDVVWGETDFLNLADIYGNIDIELVIKSSGSKRSLRRNGTRGTMIFVPRYMTLTLENVKMDGSGGEFFGNGDYSSNGINGGWYNSGVFLDVEGTVNLKSGAELTGAHTKSDTNQYVYGNSDLTNSNVPKFVSPIFVKGGTVNMYDGASIHGNWFTARVTNGGNMYSAGAILVAPGDASGNRKGTVNIYGGDIYSNKVGWDRNQESKDIYVNDRGGTINGDNSGGDVMTSGDMTSARVNHNTGDSGSSWLGVTMRNDDAMNILKRNSAASGGVNLRTPGAGAILVLASELNISGGSIRLNNGEVGAIGINGVGHAWDDLFVDSNKVDGENSAKRNNLNGGQPFATWGGKYGVLGDGHGEVTGDALKSTFKFTGGAIENNTGFSNGGVYVGRYGTMIMGNSAAVNAHNPGVDNNSAASALASSNADGIYIRGNRSWANFGGAGIGLNSQQDDETKYGGNGTAEQQAIDTVGAPKLYMYSGEISGNHSSNKAGGIYVATSEAHLYGGTIENNRGDSHGGGIYVEVKYTMEFPNLTEIANNTADHNIAGWGDEDDGSSHVDSSYVRDTTKTNPGLSPNQILAGRTDHTQFGQGYYYGYDGFGLGDSGVGGGGGLWLCPEGQSTFGDMGNLLIHDNYATKAGDDVYKVVASTFHNTGIIEMPSNDALGGKITWFRDGGYKDNNTNYSASQTWLVMQADNGQMRRPADIHGFSTWQRFGLWNYPNLWAKQEYEFKGQSNWTDAFAIKATYLPGNVEKIQSENIVKLKISGNSSARGGGIGSDGRLTFSPAEHTYSEYHDLTIKKTFADGAIVPSDAAEITFNVYIQNNKKANGTADDGTVKNPIGQVTVTKQSDGTWSGTLTGLKSEYYFADSGKTVPLFITDFKQEDYLTSITNLQSTPIVENLVIEEVGYPEYTLQGLNISYDGYEDHSYDERLEGTNGVHYQTRLTYSYTWDVKNNPSTKHEVKFSKKDLTSEENITGATLAIYKWDDGEFGGQIESWVTDGTDHVTELSAGTYALVELSTVDGYKIAAPVRFRVTSEGEVIYEKDNSTAENKTVVMYDRRESTEIKVTKDWDEGVTKQPVEVSLYADGELVENETPGFTNPVTLSESNNWTYTWKGSDAHPLEKGPNYTVVEETTGTNYVPDYDYGTSHEYWSEVEEFTNYSKVVLIKDNKYIAPRKNNGAGAFYDDQDFVGIQGYDVETDANGNLINIPDEAIWEVLHLGPNTTPGGYILINHKTKQKLVTTTTSGALGLKDLSFVPTIDGGDEFQYAGDRLSTVGRNVGYIADTEGAGDNWYRFDYFSVKPDISSTATEIQMYELTHHNQDMTVTNSESNDLMDVEVTKEWSENFTESEKQPIEVKLLKDGEEYAIVTLQESNNWYYKWENLPKANYDVEEIIPDEYENTWTYTKKVVDTASTTLTEKKDYTFSNKYGGRESTYVDENGKKVRLFRWAICLNGSNPDPAYDTVGYQIREGATYNDIKTLVTGVDLTPDAFMRLKRVTYYFIKTYATGNNFNGSAFENYQRVVANITDNETSDNSQYLQFYRVSYGLAPDSSATVADIQNMLNGNWTPDKLYEVSDTEISDSLRFTTLETDELGDWYGQTKKYQSLLYAEIGEPGSGSTNGKQFTILNDKPKTYVKLPNAGGMPWKNFMLGLYCTLSVSAAYVYYRRKRIFRSHLLRR